MADLQRALEHYINNQESPEANWRLAEAYDHLNQTAAAISFYLRAAERTDSDNLAYISLIRIAQLFEKQGRRQRTVEGIYKKAISFQPHRPEAYYFLAKIHESRSDHLTAYMLCEIGLNSGNDQPPDARINFPGDYGLIFQKAVSAWWVGKPRESRHLFRILAEDYLNKLDGVHFEAVKRNLIFLGTGPDSNAFKEYAGGEHHRLKCKFPGSDTVVQGYGQVMQDMFVLGMLDGKRDGTYLEIGSAYPTRGNNTYLLEQEFGWKGVGIEIDAKYLEEYRTTRTNPVLHQNALEVNYDELLNKLAVDGAVDYLQLDCEPPDVTYAIMERIPFDKYKFAVITFEHDHYLDMTKTFREKSRDFLKARGYKLIGANISPDDMSPFEDWWVHPDLVSADKIALMESSRATCNEVTEYMLTSNIT